MTFFFVQHMSLNDQPTSHTNQRVSHFPDSLSQSQWGSSLVVVVTSGTILSRERARTFVAASSAEVENIHVNQHGL